jgi:AcrR family transcriptional regulator
MILQSVPSDGSKGDRTRNRILDEATALASVGGVGSVTLGPLAERLGMSKSGLFAHFRSKEALQVELLVRAAERFTAMTIEPLRNEPDKAKRLQRFFENWLDWIDKPPLGEGTANSCPILAAYFEFDSVPGPVRDTAARHFDELHGLIRRLAAAAVPDADAPALCAAVSGLALSHVVRVGLLRETGARETSLRAFHALLAHPPRGASS